jgi:ribonuclease P protein component
LLDNSESKTKLRRSEALTKQEILRGHDVFQKIMRKPVVYYGKYLKAFADVKKISQKDYSQSPLFTSRVKVGFIIAKKRVRKAVNRNRIKRLMKEGYRKSDFRGVTDTIDASLLFSLTDEGLELFKNNPKIRSGIFADDLKLISDKLKNSANHK